MNPLKLVGAVKAKLQVRGCAVSCRTPWAWLPVSPQPTHKALPPHRKSNWPRCGWKLPTQGHVGRHMQRSTHLHQACPWSDCWLVSPPCGLSWLPSIWHCHWKAQNFCWHRMSSSILGENVLSICIILKELSICRDGRDHPTKPIAAQEFACLFGDWGNRLAIPYPGNPFQEIGHRTLVT